MKKTKICFTCEKKLEVSNFAKNRLKADGLQIICRACHKERYNNDKERIRKQQNEYYKNNWSKDKQKIKEKSKYNEWRYYDLKENNPEKYWRRRNQNRAWQLLNSEHLKNIKKTQKLRHAQAFVTKYKKQLSSMSKEEIMKKYEEFKIEFAKRKIKSILKD